MIIFLISFLASIIGSLCGLGGGIIIKPLLDATSNLGASTISFLSGLTVLSMSLYSVLNNIKSKDKVKIEMVMPIALGAAMGGIFGKVLFQKIASLFVDLQTITIIQSACLLILTMGTLVYSLNKDKIVTKNVRSTIICGIVGVVLGLLSSFLGIGGGPFNIIILSYLFSMETKISAQSSLYIILFSQAFSVIYTITSNTVPTFELNILILMVIAGVTGGIAGRKLNKSLSSNDVNKLFLYVNVFIIIISVYNITKIIK